MTPFDIWLLAVHLAGTAAMVGLIWFVQVVHYPLFAQVGVDEFDRYAQHHQRLTSFVVGPLMLVEGVTAVVLALVTPAGLSRVLPVTGLALLAVIHASTVGLQVPMHRRLGTGYNAGAARMLVRTNWVRTIGWSARGVLAVAMLVVATR
jgi:hypothetical protein